MIKEEKAEEPISPSDPDNESNVFEAKVSNAFSNMATGVNSSVKELQPLKMRQKYALLRNRFHKKRWQKGIWKLKQL